ncbi:pilus assembly FimT family protein [Alicyclobacillus dauci]|uniref:Prepilin-type cleavage/methylation domain-containing protein n=1 Tax=Alicyclobacillus dauci TaxID=1475485 RepID=A0ABY6Z9Z3_9BACL|nr:prepilin-type cleavage/methylation domain-containing protein [Alicyclobacillus dauci]WAH38981.1 prepilin-type cleavage/methylation domain-containing protein [Alicyclobacillus dauci]
MTWRQRYGRKLLGELNDDQHGFGLVDTMVALALTIVALGFVALGAIQLKRTADLDGAALILLGHLRLAQSLAATSDEAASVWLDPYDTRYHLTRGTTFLGQYQFPSDVDYVDGYLQLPNRRISYDNLGNAQVAGQIRLTNGSVERDIHLYMGAGLQVSGWLSQ